MLTPISLDELPALRTALRNLDHSALAPFVGRQMNLPVWFDYTLDPMSPEYRKQQMRLWRLLRPEAIDYDPERDEQFDDREGRNLKSSPGFYRPRAPGSVAHAGHHLIAMGQLLKVSNLSAGNVALEYGAGYGQIALSLARLGVEVDTVDINDVYNEAVAEQAHEFKVPLRSYKGVFGFNPRSGDAYDLIFFYEAFHHCAEFDILPRMLRSMLKPGGKVLMANEPISNGNPSYPYPWGIRLEYEAVAVAATRGWLELGFSEDFLVAIFLRSGFLWCRHDCNISPAGIVHEFTVRPDTIAMSNYRLPADIDATWHGVEPEGRWTRHVSHLPLHDLGNDGHVVISMRNHDFKPVPVRLAGREGSTTVVVGPGATAEASILAGDVGPFLRISSPTFATADGRSLGIFVLGIDYRP